MEVRLYLVWMKIVLGAIVLHVGLGVLPFVVVKAEVVEIGESPLR